MTQKPKADWLAIARDYAQGQCTIVDLCRRHGVSVSAFYRRVKSGALPHVAPRSTAPVQKAEKDYGLLRRLTQALDEKMTKFEQRLQCAEPQSAADHEREARTLHSLLRMFERVSELSDEAKRAAPVAVSEEKRGDADADFIRRQLASRLEKLRGAGHA